jgi:hypothetical protein
MFRLKRFIEGTGFFLALEPIRHSIVIDRLPTAGGGVSSMRDFRCASMFDEFLREQLPFYSQ